MQTKKKKSTKKRRSPPRGRQTPGKKPSWSIVQVKDLEKAREARGFSKAAWARHLGVGLSTYWNWIRGVSVAPLSKQRRMVSSLQAPAGMRIAAQLGAGANGSGQVGVPAQTATLGLSTSPLLTRTESVPSLVAQVLSALAYSGRLEPKEAPELARALAQVFGS